MTKSQFVMFSAFIANNPQALEGLDWTVEAEFGDQVAEGTKGTLAHHGPRSGNPCPCMEGNHPETDSFLVIGLSHIDLDSLGGVMAILGCKPENELFWEIAAQVDVRGVHRLPEIREEIFARKMDIHRAMGPRSLWEHHEDHINRDINIALEQLNAYWAFSEDHRVFAPRTGERENVTEAVREHMVALEKILNADEEMLEAGRKWAQAKEALDDESFVEEKGGVLLRSTDGFTNHLYRSGRAVVALNTKFKSVTVSLADPVPGVSCREIVQDLWGPEAGGHDGIAGSPRGQEMTLEDAEEAFAKMVDVLSR